MLRNYLSIFLLLGIAQLSSAQQTPKELWLKRYNRDRWIRIDTNATVILYLNDSFQTTYKGRIKPINASQLQVIRKKKKHPAQYDTVAIKHIEMLTYRTETKKSLGNFFTVIGAVGIFEGGLIAGTGLIRLKQQSANSTSSRYDPVLQVLEGSALVIVSAVPFAIGSALRGSYRLKRMSKWEILIR